MSDITHVSDEFVGLLKEQASILLEHVDTGNIEAAVGVLAQLQQARTPDLPDEADVMEALRIKAFDLYNNIADGDHQSALKDLQEMQNVRDKGLYQEVGRLTRALHSAITNFQIDTKTETSSEITDATDRLDYVVQLTENAANKTLDLVEESLPIADNLKQEAAELKKEWERLVQRDMTPDEFRALYWRLDDYFKSLDTDSNKLSANMTDILLAQDFQDLTGQVINKVTSLVKEVEASLVDLVYMASQVEAITGIATSGEDPAKAADMNMKGHGPQVDKEKEDVMASQDDVDDLLSSLGF
ncbi:protein phosphatase CheZ [Reinekea marinisedimentorum]|uniref:Protein phosphatase CheZ n=1 Tax=Reinekea marinisedimentorum TaxID=230495 RepID=A0A4R3I2F5_9GAMM|nr:protein phosphatase CheZ [Reinekea marinisedimentorum]TCS39947.1 chemotaxis protein CheZ [Reinekea marinisedimentorum]